jgi:hypothetical protein
VNVAVPIRIHIRCPIFCVITPARNRSLPAQRLPVKDRSNRKRSVLVQPQYRDIQALPVPPCQLDHGGGGAASLHEMATEDGGCKLPPSWGPGQHSRIWRDGAGLGCRQNYSGICSTCAAATPGSTTYVTLGDSVYVASLAIVRGSLLMQNRHSLAGY